MWILLTTASAAFGQSPFRVPPYLQHPTPSAVTILWFTDSPVPGEVVITHPAGHVDTLRSTPERALALTYNAREVDTFFDGVPPAPPYRHRIRAEGLAPHQVYDYTVHQEGTAYTARFRSAPEGAPPIRLIVYGDSETEPESTGKFTDWPDPTGIQTDRSYLVDQTLGYAANLALIRERAPDLVFITGDLVEAGAEQRDWDEFWRHNTHADPDSSLAAHLPILAVPGNHEYFLGSNRPAGPYDQPDVEAAIRRFQTYFEFPANHAPVPEREGRYFRLDYGPVTLIGLDVCNNAPNGSPNDTNFYMLGAQDSEGGLAPDFGPGSRQYTWLEGHLREAQQGGRFTFVLFHHVPYSSGVHGQAPGFEVGHDPQSGVPVRSLTALFLRYGVDAVLAGHDELWERSLIEGEEVLPDHAVRPHAMHVYDLGVGGDGLRGPIAGLENPHRHFLVHEDVPEVWDGSRLVDGGKHYGHLEINIRTVDEPHLEAVLEPVYNFPRFDIHGSTLQGFERRIYPDVVTLTRSTLRSTSTESPSLLSSPSFALFPNPASSDVTLSLGSIPGLDTTVRVVDALGRTVLRVPVKAYETQALLDISVLAPGLYVVHVENARAGVSRRLIVAR